jgi:hypothetical protein
MSDRFATAKRARRSMTTTGKIIRRMLRDQD